MLPFSILNFTLYLKENPLNYLLLQCVFQVICKRLVLKKVMLLHLLYHHFYELCHEFKNYYRIFTDGSKEGNRAAAAVVHRDNTKCVRLPDAASIFRAELYALLLAIDVVRRSKEKNFVIFSDSKSSLQSINGFNLDSDLVEKFLKDYTVLTKNGKNIILCWIPSHVGIFGNEKADAAAKSALSLPVTGMKLPATGMYPRITKLIFDEWQEVWKYGTAALETNYMLLDLL